MWVNRCRYRVVVIGILGIESALTMLAIKILGPSKLASFRSVLNKLAPNKSAFDKSAFCFAGTSQIGWPRTNSILIDLPQKGLRLVDWSQTRLL